MPYPIVENQFAEVSPGIRLHYATCGDPQAPLMLFVHGFPEAWFEWEQQMPRFADEWFVVAPDLRGFNLSSKPAGVENYRPKLILQDLLGLIKALGRTSATVVAHDWGGAIAWNMAIHAPEFVERLVIINSPNPYVFARALATNPVQKQASEYMNWLRKPGSESVLFKDDFALLDGFFTGSGQDGRWFTPELRERYHRMWQQPASSGEHPMTGAVNYYRATPLRPVVEEEGNQETRMNPADWRTNVPVRVIWAEADRALPIHLIEGLDEVCSDLRIVRIPGAGHWVVHERPDEITTHIRAALKD